MSTTPDPARSTLRALVDAESGSIEEIALVIARDAHPTISVSCYLDRLEALAAPLETALSLARPPAQAAILGDALYGDAGLRGNGDDYYDPRNSYLDDVMDRGLGIPVTLAVVVLAVARRAGLDAEGVGFPGHFLVRLGGPEGVLVDPFDRLRVLDGRAVAQLAEQHLGGVRSMSPRHLEGATKRSITLRLLSNLRAIHRLRGDHAGALVVCDRLVELDAGIGAVRDRGLAALALGGRAQAKSDLERYLATVPEAPDRQTVERALAVATQPSTWN